MDLVHSDVVRTWLVVLVAGVALGLVGIYWAARQSRRRWGKVTSTSSGDGASRAGEVTSSRDRDTPAIVKSAGMVALLWAWITGLVFVPLGGLLALLNFELEHAPIAGLVAVCASTSGLVLAVLLGVTAFRLVRRRAEPQRTQALVRFCYAHHAGVWLSLSLMTATAADASEAVVAAGLLAIPCGLGMWVAHRVQRAQAAAEALPKEEPDLSASDA
jgi:hypothetical protein